MKNKSHLNKIKLLYFFEMTTEKCEIHLKWLCAYVEENIPNLPSFPLSLNFKMATMEIKYISEDALKLFKTFWAITYRIDFIFSNGFSKDTDLDCAASQGSISGLGCTFFM